MLKKLFLSLLVLILIGAGVAAFAWQQFNQYMTSPLALEEPIESYIVERGRSFNGLLQDLEKQGVISQPLFVKVYARMNQLGNKIKAGEYYIDKDLTPIALLDKFVVGDSVQHSFTIVEGHTFKQVKQALANNDVLEQTLQGKSDAEILKLIGAKENHPEGLFLAETYQLVRGTSDLDLLKRSYKALEAELEQSWAGKAENLPYKSPDEVLIMASIVEKETAVPAERPKIAGVFIKRMQIGMRLQTDPTVIYGMGDDYKGNIRRKDLRKPTAYNTYTIDGLPPTPIAMVGRDAIQASLHPEIGRALYFVARGDGSHYFSSSLKEHNRAVRDYQLRRKEAYRSTPEK